MPDPGSADAGAPTPDPEPMPDPGSADAGAPTPTPGAGTMIAIPAGGFAMGCNGTVDVDCSSDENPSHLVTLPGYAIDTTEVTNAAYKACIDAGTCPPPGEVCAATVNVNTADAPAVCVTWFDAHAYCQFAGKRLPTEAEWEYAARGADGRVFPWGNAAANCTLAAYVDCDSLGEVGRYPLAASPYGALDMAGNAREWVADFYHPLYYMFSPTNDPPGFVDGSARIARGGSAGELASMLRVSDRAAYYPSTTDAHMGFRCAADSVVP
jgi:formylglycine-generating enzyme required for sulfatase activity